MHRPVAHNPVPLLATLLATLLAAFVTGPANSHSLFAEPPSVTQLFPPVVEAGQTSTITVSGDNLGTIRQLASGTGQLKTESVKKNAVTVRVAAATGTRLIDVWTLTSTGLANPRALLVVTHPVRVVTETPDSEASPISLPGTVASKLDRAADRDTFAFTGGANQLVHLTCRSSSLDGSVAPVLSIKGPDGTELAHSPVHQIEPTVTLRLPVSGRYLVTVVDRGFGHNLSSIYTLTALAGPRLVLTSPTALDLALALALAKNTSPLILLGHRLPGGAVDPSSGWTTLSVEFDRPPSTPTWPDRRPVGVLQDGFRMSLADSIGSPWVTLSDEPVVIETTDANDTAAAAQALKLPARVCGRFEKPADIDWYSVDLKKGETLEITGWGERLGQAMRLEAIVHDKSGKALATIGTLAAPKKLGVEFPFTTNDPHGDWKAPAEGRYTIVVRDLYGGSLFGPDRVYQLVVGPPRPRFQAFSVVGDGKSHSGLTIAAGGTSTLQIVVVRSGGAPTAVEVSVEGLPEGVTAKTLSVPADKPVATLTLTATAQAKPGLVPIRVLARAPGKQPARDVLPLVHLAGPAPSRRVADALLLSVTLSDKSDKPAKPADKKSAPKK